VNTAHVHKTIQHSSSYCINLSENGAHICEIVLFALAILVYIRCYSSSNVTEYKTLIVLPGIWNDIDWLFCMSRYVLYIYTEFIRFIFTRCFHIFSESRKSHFLTQLYTYRKTSFHTCRKTSSEITVFNIQKDFILSHQLIKLW
jgi:hypothetical protein